MDLICKITDRDIGETPIEMNNPRLRLGARGIVIREDGKIAIFNKSNKNEYKLPGGGIEEGEKPEEAFRREVLEETGCEIKIIECLGTTEEYKSLDNFKQISYVFIGKVTHDTKKLKVTQKEKDEGAKLLWETPENGLEFIIKSYDKLIASKYESIYHTKFIVLRDRRILEKYISMRRNVNLAYTILNNSISLKTGDNLLVESIGEDGLELAYEIIKQAKEMNANPILNLIRYNTLKEFLINASKEEIIEYGKKDYDRMKNMQAYIGISAPTSDKTLEGVPQEKLEYYNKYYTAVVHLKQRVKHTKWCILRYPNEYFASKSKMTLDEFKNFYYNVCNVDYDKMKIAMEPLKELMNKTDKVHIIAPGTDLIFSIKGIPAEKYYGTFNIPDGEVATCPVKDSINGYITYNTKTKYNDIIFENIRFDFKDGKIITATAKNHTKELNEILNTDEGARYIGEFAFGLNPYINDTICDTLFDEKINGSFHLTPGMALEESDNGNRSAIHWDIVKILREEFGGGEIYFDDVLINKNGRFVLEELKPLNAENLK